MRLLDQTQAWLSRRPWWETPDARDGRAPVDHVVIIDGSLSRLKRGQETNAGLAYKLLRDASPGQEGFSLHYERGLQLPNWTSLRDLLEGRGINRQIRRAYRFLASRYRPGDRIFLFGYSRGAYAARSLAGVIGRVGLLRPEHARSRRVLVAYRHYQRGGQGADARRFRDRHCHDRVEIQFLGVWDTVKALGMRLPFLWRLTESRYEFHDHELGDHIRHAFHALALHETRAAFAPVLWDTRAFGGHAEQAWFRGSHGDVGGQLDGYAPARPLANIPLVWMLEHAEACGLALPEEWQNRFPRNPRAPSVGTLRNWGKLFLARRRRAVGADPSEYEHPSVELARRARRAQRERARSTA